MFLAIINDTYSEVKSEKITSDIHLGSYIKGKWGEIVERLVNVIPFLRRKRSKVLRKRREKETSDSEQGNTPEVNNS